ncbi:MAG: lytic transglycosylase, partial [Sporichthyaceae bacterium]
GVDPLNPSAAIDGAGRLLAAPLDRFDSLPRALAANNAGAGAFDRAGGIPPYAETRAYVQKVLDTLGAGA